MPPKDGDSEPPCFPEEVDSNHPDWRLLASIAGLGAIRIRRDVRLVSMDSSAAAHHHIHLEVARTLSLDFWLSILSDADQLRMHSLLRSEISRERTEIAVVRLRWCKEGEPPTLELSFRMDRHGEDLICASRDVTAAQGLEEARRHRVAAERASRAKSEFMSQVSHELRTPLNSILGFSQLIAMDTDHPIPRIQQERLQVLHQSGLRLLSLVDQLLQIGKIEQGQQTLRTRPVAVHAIVRRCVAAMAPMAEERDISVEIDMSGDDSSAVRADADALEQVLINLLSNGIKYNRQGGRLSVKYRVAESSEITVNDTGHGLTKSQLVRLFEPFNRLDAGKTGIQGTGLGLVISRQLIEAMHGTLNVWSEPGIGSRFEIALPNARRTRPKEDSTLELSLPSQWVADRQFRVLYVEDDDVNVVLLDQIFSLQTDWQLIVAMTGTAGIMEAVRQEPDLILLDLMLPDMTGWDVIKQLKRDRRTKTIPVVAVSADAMPGNLRRSRAAGFVEYWTKPLDLPSTIKRLKVLCTSLTH